MSNISWNGGANFAGVNGFNSFPDLKPNTKPGFDFNMPPPAKSLPVMEHGVSFKPECNESVAHVLRGLSEAVRMLLDDGRFDCRPNDCAPKQDSWCFPQVEYTPVTLPKDCWQPNQPWAAPLPEWKFNDSAMSQVQQMGQRFSNFFAN